MTTICTNCTARYPDHPPRCPRCASTLLIRADMATKQDAPTHRIERAGHGWAAGFGFLCPRTGTHSPRYGSEEEAGKGALRCAHEDADMVQAKAAGR